jgi:hypothetical protein
MSFFDKNLTRKRSMKREHFVRIVEEVLDSLTQWQSHL